MYLVQSWEFLFSHRLALSLIYQSVNVKRRWCTQFAVNTKCSNGFYNFFSVFRQKEKVLDQTNFYVVSIII